MKLKIGSLRKKLTHTPKSLPKMSLSQPTQSLPREEGDTTVPCIPIELVSEEEMALIEAAFSAASSSLSSSYSAIPAVFPSSSSLCPTQFQPNARSVRSVSLLSRRRSSTETGSTGDTEDIAGSGGFGSTQKEKRLAESFLHRYRRNRGLSVTDITATEWCEKQMEFFLLFGKPEATKAMKAGSARHAVLEEEVVERVKVQISTKEDLWALKFINFMSGVNQLLFDGLTRELPILGFVEGVWMVGVIDEIRMPVMETEKNPILIDTKTRGRTTLPSEPQRRNGRLQLMCYKYLWDNLVADTFPSEQFFNFFSLNPHFVLSEELRENTALSGFPAETLDELVRFFQNFCCMLSPAHDQLLLRYELQGDHSLLGEDHFVYDSNWLKGQLQCGLEFWMGEREANYTSEEERWKCRFCQFASECPINANSNSKPSQRI